MPTTVAKFGGSSLADAERVCRVIKIIQADPDRRYVVVSAPGRVNSTDDKVTDLLIAAATARTVIARRKALDQARRRFIAICRGLPRAHEIEDWVVAQFKDLATALASDIPPPEDYVKSRGEFYMARLLGHALNWFVVDPLPFIRLTADGRYDRPATEAAFDASSFPVPAVIPGFYGAGPSDEVVTFSRNGSDITGSIVAALTGAERYENWTDTNGILAADPRVIANPRSIGSVTRAELLELAYRGSAVLHGEALAPLQGTDVLVLVKNTFVPTLTGTLVVPRKELLQRRESSVVGIASLPGYSVLTIRKTGMTHEIGFLETLLRAFRKTGINVTLTPAGLETQSVIFEDTQLGARAEELLRRVRRMCKPESVELERKKLALICVVGETMAHHEGLAGRVFTVVANAGINVRTIDQGATEISIVFGVECGENERAVRALYREFFAFK